MSGSGGEHVEDGAAVPPIQLGGSTSPMQGPGTASDGGSVGDIGSHVYISVDEYENAAVKRIKVWFCAFSETVFRCSTAA